MYLAYAQLATTRFETATDGVVPIELEDVYTMVPKWEKFENNDTAFIQAMAKGNFLGLHGYPSKWESRTLNTNDLENPVPARSFYAAAKECWDDGLCATITDDTYHPTIILKPRALAAIHPALSTCVQWKQGFDDPAIAITVVPTLDVPKVIRPTSMQEPTPAVLPAFRPNNPLAMPTALPQPLHNKPVGSEVAIPPLANELSQPDGALPGEMSVNPATVEGELNGGGHGDVLHPSNDPSPAFTHGRVQDGSAAFQYSSTQPIQIDPSGKTQQDRSHELITLLDGSGLPDAQGKVRDRKADPAGINSSDSFEYGPEDKAESDTHHGVQVDSSQSKTALAKGPAAKIGGVKENGAQTKDGEESYPYTTKRPPQNVAVDERARQKVAQSEAKALKEVLITLLAFAGAITSTF